MKVQYSSHTRDTHPQITQDNNAYTHRAGIRRCPGKCMDPFPFIKSKEYNRVLYVMLAHP